MIDTLSEAGSWGRAIRDGRIPVTDYTPTSLHDPADQRGEGGKVRGFGKAIGAGADNQLHNGAMHHD